MSTDMTVANTILEQLGGRRFQVMTGAKQFVGGKDCLGFLLPSGFASNGINMVVVRLTAADDYTITFSRTRGLTTKVIYEADGVYGDQLQDVFCEHTGLFTSL